jgi:hypothetical protein
MGFVDDFNDKNFKITDQYIEENAGDYWHEGSNSLLHEAIKLGRRDLVEAIVTFLAKQPRHTDAYRLLVKRNHLHLTPLYYAAAQKQYDLFDLMVRLLNLRDLAIIQDFQSPRRGPGSFVIADLVHKYHLPLNYFFHLADKICDGTWRDLDSLLWPTNKNLNGYNTKNQLLNAALEEGLIQMINATIEGLKINALTHLTDYQALGIAHYLPNYPHRNILEQRNAITLQYIHLIKNDELPKIAKLFGGYEGLVSRIAGGAPSNAAEVLSHVGLLITMKEQAAGDSKKIAQLQASLESFRSGKTASVPTSSATYKKTAPDENKGLLSNSSSSSSHYGLFKKK